eukprot:GCRY01003621.1.p1 GENE.GCRY01003621.1~~GCRY01003621.1.p1  ORF type:complete len:620 (+),score=146.90 GCRY01003621.1:155-2014(+)
MDFKEYRDPTSVSDDSSQSSQNQSLADNSDTNEPSTTFAQPTAVRERLKNALEINPKKPPQRKVIRRKTTRGKGSMFNAEESKSGASNNQQQLLGSKIRLQDDISFLLECISSDQPDAARCKGFLRLITLIKAPQGISFLKKQKKVEALICCLEAFSIEATFLCGCAVIYFLCKEPTLFPFFTRTVLSKITAPQPLLAAGKNHILEHELLAKVTTVLHVIFKDEPLPPGPLQPAVLLYSAFALMAHYSEAARHDLRETHLLHTCCKEMKSEVQHLKEFHRVFTGSGFSSTELKQKIEDGDLPEEFSLSQTRLLSQLAFLEAVAFNCRRNQNYLLTLELEPIAMLLSLVFFAVGILRTVTENGALPAAMVDVLLASLRVLINLSNGNSEACDAIADLPPLPSQDDDDLSDDEDITLSENSGLQTLVSVYGVTPPTTPTDAFDIYVGLTALLVNLSEKHVAIRSALAHTRTQNAGGSIDLLRFLAMEFTNGVAEGRKYSEVVEPQRTPEVDQAETECNIRNAYTALLVGCLARGKSSARTTLLSNLPGQAFDEICAILEEFLCFCTDSQLLTQDAVATCQEVIRELGEGEGAPTTDAISMVLEGNGEEEERGAGFSVKLSY